MQMNVNQIPEQFSYFLKHSCQCNGSESVLLAISGGIDSMVMLNLFHRQGIKIAIAHCNFSLRGRESDGDEAFVRQVARDYCTDIFVKKFDTRQYADQSKISIQMAARDLRYQWFEELLRSRGFDLIAMAHQRDDSVETFLINLSRGTGITGLTGIKAKNNKVIRPLLFLSRQEITAYAVARKIGWREDSSNETVKYLRNKIRHVFLPEINKILPGFENAVNTTMMHLQEVNDILDEATVRFANDAVTGTEQRKEINISKIINEPHSGILLYQVLQPYGFNYDTVSHLMDILNGQPGKHFFSRTHELTVDRSRLILQPMGKMDASAVEISADTALIQYPVNLKLQFIENTGRYVLPGDKNIASFDADAIKFPMIIRRWKNGDYFYPLGMKGKKKLSDFFVDEKIALPDKKGIWILESAGNIVWVIGLRIDDRFKVTASTRRILQIVYHSGGDG
ncbi:MAG: tRNA lysidine(34) synthetase TilS [Bacteroidales bacterium]|nr:tRNA lysidine(34) synthetase TilS [Bacteroidales bacterium]